MKLLKIIIVCLVLQLTAGCALVPDSIGLGYNQGRYAGEEVMYKGWDISFQWNLK